MNKIFKVYQQFYKACYKTCYKLGLLIVLPFEKLLKLVYPKLSFLKKYKKTFKKVSKTKVFKFYKKRRLIIIPLALIIFFTPLAYLFTRHPKEVEAVWWHDSWHYRQTATITHTGDYVTEYQVLIDGLDTSTLVTNSKMQTDCGDIRFVTEDGVNLDYSIAANSCNTTDTKIWVKIDSISTEGKTIYMYYGNPSAVNTESESKTFSYSEEKTVAYPLHSVVNDLQLISLENDNSISHNGVTKTLDKYETDSFTSISQWGPITAKKPFNADDTSDETDTIVPVSWAGTEFYIYSRDAIQTVYLWILAPWGDANVTAYYSGVAISGCTNITVTSSGNSLACASVGLGTIRVRSTNGYPILVFTQPTNDDDEMPVHPATTQKWIGGGSTTYVVNGPASNDWRYTYDTLGVGESNPVNLAANSFVNMTGPSGYGGRAVLLWSDNVTNFSAQQIGDGDGGDGHQYNDVTEQSRTFGSANIADYISVATTAEATCSVYEASDNSLVGSSTATSSNNVIYHIGFGTGGTTAYTTGAWYMECDKPVSAHYQKALTSEGNLMHYPNMRQFTYPTPSISSLSTEEEGGTDLIAYWSFDEGYGTTIHNNNQDSSDYGLVSWWKMDEDTGNTCSGGEDSCDSYYNNHGTWYGNTTNTDGKIGNAITLDGTGDYVSFGNDSSLSADSMTWMVWSKSNTSVNSANTKGILFKAATTAGTNRDVGLVYVPSTAYIQASISNGTENVNLKYNVDTYDATWHHYAVVKEYGAGNDKFYLYVDGVLRDEGTLGGTGVQTSAALEVGRVSSASTSLRYMDGVIDDVKVYNRALSYEEISAEFNSLNGQLIGFNTEEIIYATSDDAYIQGADASYNTAWNTSSQCSTSSNYIELGQYSGAVYQLYRGYMDFDTSILADHASILDVKLFAYVLFDYSTPDYDVNIYKYNITEPICSNRETNYDASGQILDQIWQNTADISEDSYFSNSTSLNTSWIDKTGNTNYLLRSSREVAQTVPTGNELLYLASEDNVGSSSDPYLQITINPWVQGAKSNENQKPMGKGLAFNGTSDYITVQDNSGLDVTDGQDFSISTWVKREDVVDTARMIISKRTSINESDAGYALWLKVNNGVLRLEISDGTDEYSMISSDAIPNDGKWHHLVVVFDESDASNCTMYINGVEKTGDKTGTIGDIGSLENDDEINIGRLGNGSYPFDGSIDEVKFFSSVLTADQVKKEYNRGYSVVMGAGEQENIGSPPVGFWKLDEGAGYTTFDSSGNNNDGYLATGDSAPIWTSGMVGKGLEFDGTNDYVNILHDDLIDFDDSDSFTVSGWIKTTGHTGGSGTIVAKVTSGLVGYQLYVGANTARIILEDGSNYPAVESTSIVNDGDWHHVAGVRNVADDKIYIYVDGVLENSATDTTTSTISNSEDVTIGRFEGGNFFNGKIDHVKIYDYVRTEEQIHQDMATGSPVGYWKFDEGYGTTIHNSQEKNGESDLIAWWKFDEGTGSSAIDEMQNYDSTITGASWSTTGKTGNTLDYDGTNDYVSISDGLIDEWTEFTVMAWINPDTIVSATPGHGSNDTANAILDKSGSAGDDNFAFLLGVSDELYLYIDTGADYMITTTSSPVQTGEWTHVVGRYDGSTLEIFADGVSVGSTAASGTIIDGPNGLKIGNEGDLRQDYDGEIDNLKIYSRALTNAEINSEYESMHGHMVKMDPSSDWVTGAWPNSNQKPMGKGLDFDGVDDFVSISDVDDLDITTAISISLWVKIDDAGTDINPNQFFLNKGTGDNSDATNNSYSFGIVNTTNDRVFFRLSNGSTITYTADDPELRTNNLDPNAWYHFVGTWDGTTIKFYKNGVYIPGADTSFSGPIQSLPDTPLKFGRLYDNTRFFDGKLDEVKIYNYTLTDNEVKVEYNRGKALVLGAGKSAVDPDANSPIGWWKMDEGSANTVFDSSSNSSHGSLGPGNSAPSWSQGYVGKALEFDGTDDYVNLDSHYAAIEGKNTGTITGWFKSTDIDGGQFFSLFDKDSTNDIWQVGINEITGAFSDESLWFALRRGGGGVLTFMVRNGDDYYADGAWHHFAVCTGDNDNRIYVDGVRQAVTFTAGSVTTDEFSNINNPDSMQMGRRNYGGTIGMHFKGSTDNIKIYDYALSDAQVAWSYNQGKPIYHWRFDDDEGVLATNEQGKAVPTNGLVGFWPLEYLSGSTALDRSGNGYNGSLGPGNSAPTLVAGRKGNALEYDGNDDYITLLDQLPDPTSVTITAWIYGDAWTASGYNHIYDDNGDLALAVYDGKLAAYADPNGGWWAPNISLGTTEWYHVAYTYDGATQKLFVNGVEEASDTATGSWSYTTNGQYIGFYNYDYDGKMDHVKIFDRALSSAEILTDYTSDEKYGYLTNMDPASDWVDGAWPNPNQKPLGKALDFDGGNDEVRIGDSDNLSFGDSSNDYPFSISAWLYMHSADDFYIFSKRSGSDYEYSLHTSGLGELSFIIYDATSGNYEVSNADLSDYENQWLHLVATYDGSGSENGMTIYLNTVETSSGSGGGGSYTAMHNTTATASIGLTIANGVIDEVKIYNYELSPNQVKVDYNNSKAVRF
ncbi:DUF2341 domain-containing protein [Patescibacteria group bacterium]